MPTLAATSSVALTRSALCPSERVRRRRTQRHPAGRQSHCHQLPEPVATAVTEFMTTTLIREPRRVGKPLRRELSPVYGPPVDGPIGSCMAFTMRHMRLLCSTSSTVLMSTGPADAIRCRRPGRAARMLGGSRRLRSGRLRRKDAGRASALPLSPDQPSPAPRSWRCGQPTTLSLACMPIIRCPGSEQ